MPQIRSAVKPDRTPGGQHHHPFPAFRVPEHLRIRKSFFPGADRTGFSGAFWNVIPPSGLYAKLCDSPAVSL